MSGGMTQPPEMNIKATSGADGNKSGSAWMGSAFNPVFSGGNAGATMTDKVILLLVACAIVYLIVKGRK